ncbi:M24 family metallopeptidase [Microbaculum sp. FT89]|uniref:M24 family metallopeptidase n=1 Tax=Microbaculum sp. FT89 TaxID=3447298 RepID=UPI003F53278C
MDKGIREGIDWEQPFPDEEYAQRRARVQRALERAGYDGMLVTAPRDYHYLTGHDHIWQYRHAVIGLYFDTASGSFVFFDNTSHKVLISNTPQITDILYNSRSIPAAEQAVELAEKLLARGWGRGRVAIQTWGYGCHPDHVRTVGRRFAAAGAEIVEDSDLIEDVRLYKSPREVAVIREAAAISVAAMEAARDFMRPGVAETEIDAVVCYELMKRGCGHPGIRNMFGSGPRSGCHHSPATHRRLRQGDVVHVDFSASLHRYHANISRSFAVGEIDQRWHDLFDRSADCSRAIVEGVGPGDPFSKVQKAADAFIAASGVDRARYEWFIGGYTLGIAFPPDWVHRHRPEPFEPADDPAMEPGMVFNFEVQYDVFDGWPGGSGGGWIDSYLMTEDGLEILTEMPRNLMVVGG